PWRPVASRRPSAGGTLVPRKPLYMPFTEQMKDQLRYLRNPHYAYRGLQLYVSGVPEPWQFVAGDDFEFHDEAGVLIVRDGPTDPERHDNADVPEYVFRLDSVVATQLV